MTGCRTDDLEACRGERESFRDLCSGTGGLMGLHEKSYTLCRFVVAAAFDEEASVSACLAILSVVQCVLLIPSRTSSP